MLSTMPNLAHPLFSAPADAIDTEMVRDFLSLQLEESFTVDYKRGYEAAAETVAAMANTYGGIILIGVDPHQVDKNLPGALPGVKPIDKDKLVTKMATTFDPPGWTPDVVPVTIDEKLLLVVRIDPDSVPRPLFHQGAVRVRLDGRNATADRRLVHILFQQASMAPAPTYFPDPRFAPDTHAAPRSTYQNFPPDLVIRAAASRPLKQETVRFRLHGTTVDALQEALSAPGYTGAHHVPERLHSFAKRVNPQLDLESWTVDPAYGSAWFVRLTAGHEKPAVPVDNPRLRMECSTSLAGNGTSLDVFFDLLFWTGGLKVADDLWVQGCYEAVRALARDALPSLTKRLLGTALLPTPQIELHIAHGTERSLLRTLSLDWLGHRTGTGALPRGSDYLPDDLLAAGDLPQAVIQTLRNIALDWRYLHPNLPLLHD
ncbi:AlbA family DNA-binding domain-containing protein [Streptomyces griseoluteus]|uniref:AlbA family DNA-binding domain-containing protein n=1 Tax=Streptomyces griseoluteus TaxID=29306 RepID=UPI00343DCFDB